MEHEEEIRVNKVFYKQLTRKISLVNKRILNEDIQLGNIEKLEKEALRGAVTERPEAKPEKKVSIKPSYLSLILKSEHKVDTDTCIVKLPKMPYGKHKNYNDEPKFVANHFINTNRIIDVKQAEDFKEISRKFRLQDKHKASQKRNQTGAAKNRQSKDYDVYDMEHGELKCERNNIVISSYLTDKAKYRRYIYDVPKTSKSSRVNQSRKQQGASIDRLHNSFKTNDSHLASFFVTKYSRLFNKDSNIISSTKVPTLDLSIMNL